MVAASPDRDPYRDIHFERIRQERIHKGMTAACGIGDAARYLILAEEVGEVAKSVNDMDPMPVLREELVQVAAVAVAWIEWIDKRRKIMEMEGM